MAASKTSLLDEILVNLLLILSGMFFSNAGGWLLWLCTYNVIVWLHVWFVGSTCEVEGHI